MYFVFGENQESHNGFGRGKTIQLAIYDWAYSENPKDIQTEFEEFEPTVIEGDEIKVSMKIEYAVTFNIT